MLLSLLTLSLFSLNNPDVKIGDMSQDICQDEEVIKIVGIKGSCRMIVAPRKREQAGECMGIFANSLPCKITYSSDKTVSALNIQCGTDPENPSVDQNMEIEVSSFNVAAVLTLEDGKTKVLNDPNLFTSITNRLIEITITETEVKKEAAILINTQAGKQALTEVSCR